MSGVLAHELEEAGRELGRRLAAGGDQTLLHDLIGNILEAVNGNVQKLKDWIFEHANLDWLPDLEDFNPFGDFFNGLREALGGLINPGRIPFLPIGHIGQAQPNLLVNGDFSGEVSLDGEGVWTWDGTTGHTGPGSARTTGDGTRKVLTSNSVECSEDQKFAVSGRVRWADAVGSGPTMRLALVPYVGPTPQAEVPIAAITNPAADSGGNFSSVSGNYTAGPGVTAVRVRVTVEAALTAGTVWWDDMKLSKTATSLPQQWIQNLVGDLFDLDALAAGAQNLANAAQSAINQIGEILMGAIVTPITTAVQRVKDWFLEFIGFKTVTTTDIKTTRNAVWAGATRQDPDEDKSSEQLESALAALRSRAQATALENELMSLGSVPVSDGPSSAGDVTISVSDVDWFATTPLNGTTGGQSAGTAHTHGAGSLNVPTPVGGLMIVSHASGVYSSTDLFSTFRARSTLPKEIITFAARGIASELAGAWVSLETYDEEIDKWVTVAVGDSSYHTQLGTDFTWIDVSLAVPYTPAIGELMAVRWTAQAKPNTMSAMTLASSRQNSMPAYHSVPYGLLGIVQVSHGAAFKPLTVGNQTSAPRLVGGDEVWLWGQVPYAQIGPDLGQLDAVVQKLDFYDDFNRLSLGEDYIRFSSSGVVPGLANNRLAFRDTNNGMQAILRRQQLATSKIRVEATLTSAGSTASADLIINSNSSMTNFLTLAVGASNIYIYTGTNVGAGTQRKTVPSSDNNVRWAVDYDPATKRYSIFKSGVFFTDWQDTTDIVWTGPGQRFCGAATSRNTFFNSGQWDDLLMYDVDY